MFNDYVNHFFEIKSKSEGLEKQIAKLQLNTLYGYFGRKLENIEAITVRSKDFRHYLSTCLVKNYVRFDKDLILILIEANKSEEFYKDLEKIAKVDKDNRFTTPVKSNVAIASAITS